MLDIVAAHEHQASVVADFKHRHRGWHRQYGVVLMHLHLFDAGRHHHFAAGVEAEGAHVIVVRVGVLYQCRLAALRINGKCRDAVFAAVEHRLPLVIGGAVGAVGEVDVLS